MTPPSPRGAVPLLLMTALLTAGGCAPKPVPAQSFAQETPDRALRSRDEVLEPFQRPAPLVSVENEHAPLLLRRIRSVLRDHRFVLTRYDDGALEIEARCPEPGDDGAYDGVLVWLERDGARPTDLFHLHLLYGRFETDESGAIRHVPVSPSFRSSRVGAVEADLFALAG